MAGLADFRKQYPQYDDMGDAELADALHGAHYSDMPRGEFYDSIGLKTSQGLGFAKGVQNVMEKIPGLPGVGRGPLNDEATQQAIHDWTDKTPGVRPGTAGNIAGGMVASAPLAFVGGPMTSGALQGYATSEADSLGGKAFDTALGAVGGKVVGEALSGLGRALGSNITPEARALASEGVSLTPGMARGGKAMIREDKAMSRPVVGEVIGAARQNTQDTFNRATVNQALKPLGITLPDNIATGQDAVAFLQDAVGDAYRSVIPKLAVQPDKRMIAGAAKGAQELRGRGDDLMTAYTSGLKDIFRWDQGNALSGRMLQDAQSTLGRLASDLSRSDDPAQRALGRAYSQAREGLTSSIKAQNPAEAPKLRAANAGYRGERVVTDAASRADAGIFNTGQLKQAVRRGDGSKGKTQTARGAAYMQPFSENARAVIPAKVPDSGTAGRTMDAKMLPRVKGAVDAMGARADQALTRYVLTPEGAWLLPIATSLIPKLQRPGGMVGAAVATAPTKKR